MDILGFFISKKYTKECDLLSKYGFEIENWPGKTIATKRNEKFIFGKDVKYIMDGFVRNFNTQEEVKSFFRYY